MKSLTPENITTIINETIDFNSLEKNTGILEFYSDSNLSIGISFEDIEKYKDITYKDVYIFNLFLNDEYINIEGEYARTDDGSFVDVEGFNRDISCLLSEAWNEHIKIIKGVLKLENNNSIKHKNWTIFENEGEFVIGGYDNTSFSDCTLENLNPSIDEFQMVEWCRNNGVHLKFRDLRGPVEDVTYDKYLEHLNHYKTEKSDDFLSEEFVVPIAVFSSVDKAKEFIDYVEAKWLGKESKESLADKINSANLRNQSSDSLNNSKAVIQER